jgi:predicted GIY-YIG superfamily endonuclease
MRGGWVYIMTNEPDGALYTGVTSNVARRAFERREGLIDGFTRRYGLKRLVLTEFYEDIARRDSAREQHQALAARLEGAPHPRRESRMA